MQRSQIDAAKEKGFDIFVCNNAYQLAPYADLLYGCNYAWWQHYWQDVKDLPAEKWTVNRDAADEFGINWIAEKNAPGLSTDPDVIHHGHGSGYSLVSMAYRAGAERIVLLGYDLKYARDYDAGTRNAGSTPRHFFENGEYPESMQHWPSMQVRNGVHVELCALYDSIAKQGLVEIINATPDSAITCFPKVDIAAI